MDFSIESYRFTEVFIGCSINYSSYQNVPGNAFLPISVNDSKSLSGSLYVQLIWHRIVGVNDVNGSHKFIIGEKLF